jgi:hypothetical protein
MVGHDVAEPQTALAELLGVEIIEFRWEMPEVTEAVSPESPVTPDVPAEPAPATPIVWAAGEQRPMLGMLVEPDDDDQEMPAPNWCMDYTATVLIEAAVRAS